jgi:hypothetical protein
VKTLFCLIALTLTAWTQTFAAELKPLINNQTLGVSLSSIAYPDTLKKDLTSGLENNILIRVTLTTTTGEIDHREIVVTIKYDLWLETFRLRLVVGSANAVEKTFARTEDVLAYLNKLDVGNVFAINALAAKGELSLRADILVNPVDRERIERLRQWVAANSTPRDVIGNKVSGAPATSRPNDLFNTIFEQYLRGESVSAAWRTTVLSKPFRMDPAPE